MGNQPYKRTLEHADAFFAEVTREQPQHLQCGRGCSLCCYGLFEITAADAVVVAEGLAQMHPMRRKKIIRRAQEILERAGPRDGDKEAFFAKTDDVACPNLDENGLCMMYEHRPLVCRTFGLPIRDGSEYIGDICELNFTSATQPEKESAAWDLQWEDIVGPEDELTIPEAIVVAARMRGWL